MSIRGFIQQGKKSQNTNANARDENSRQPFDFSDDRDLPIKRKEFEEEEEIPFRARQIGCVGWVGFGFGATPINVASKIRTIKMPSDTIRSLKMLSGQKHSPVIEFAFVAFVDFLFCFVVHKASSII